MANFYNSISENYEDIFTPSTEQISFLLEKANNKVLDIACATGKVARKIQEKGFDVLGIDLEESFIQKAKAQNKIKAINLNMLDIDKLEDDYGLIYCIGNSMVHLSSRELIRKFLINCYKKLEYNGHLVLSIVNFYPFLKNSNDFLGSLPTIKNENVEFIRKYYRNDKFIRFNTVMTSSTKTIENNINLFPILKSELEEMLIDIGFNNLEIYGGFDKSNFDINNSIQVVVRAKKGVD